MATALSEIKAKCSALINAPKEHPIATYRMLMIASIACSLLAFIPPLRTIGTLGSRLAVSAALASRQPAGNSAVRHLLNISKVTLAALAVIGLLIASPILLSIALVADIAVNAFEAYKAIRANEKEKALMHVGIIALDALALAGVLAGSWQIMLTAAIVNVGFIAAIGLKALHDGEL